MVGLQFMPQGQRYSREIIEQVLAANDIVDIIGARIELKPSGTHRFKALSPFTQEKTPSFMVSRDRQRYHCFSSGRGGDALTFLMEHDGLSFMEALQKLADRGGVPLPKLRGGGGEDTRRREVLAFAVFAARHFRETLNRPREGEPGRQYLQTRQLKESTVERFGLGYAPDSWDHLLAAVRDGKRSGDAYHDAVLEASGLFKRGQRGLYDFFRNRLMFPIRDVTGNVVAFGGRALDDNPAKYVNSPENVVYKKGKTLYGLYEARDALRQAPYALIVEGYFDLLRCFDAGLENVVAPCGTALTAEQARLIKRYVGEAVLLFDGDAAGVKAALRSTAVLVAAGLRVRALCLPDGQDPDDFVRAHGIDALRTELDSAPDFIDFFVRMRHEDAQSIEGRTALAREVFEVLAGIEDAVRREDYLKRLARALGLSEYACHSDFERYRRGDRRAALQPGTPQGPAFTVDDRDFIAVLLETPVLRERAQMALAEVDLPDNAFGRVLNEVLATEEDEPGSGPHFDDEAAAALYAAAATCEAPEGDRAELLVLRRLVGLQRQALQARSRALLNDIQRAQRAGDAQQALQLTVEKTQLDSQLEKLGAA